MFDLGDELLIGSHRIPWLLWIQLVVMLLLIILLYYSAVFSLGVDPSPVAAADSPHQQQLSTVAAANRIRLHKSKVGENSRSIKGGTGTSASTRRVGRDDVQEREGSSGTKDTSLVLERSHHPCSFLGFAKQAFLKCLGLDPDSQTSSSNTRQKKKKEE